VGGLLGTVIVPATGAGYRQALDWLSDLPRRFRTL
jgi:hypothetical protein